MYLSSKLYFVETFVSLQKTFVCRLIHEMDVQTSEMLVHVIGLKLILVCAITHLLG